MASRVTVLSAFLFWEAKSLLKEVAVEVKDSCSKVLTRDTSFFIGACGSSFLTTSYLASTHLFYL